MGINVYYDQENMKIIVYVYFYVFILADMFLKICADGSFCTLCYRKVPTGNPYALTSEME